MNCKFEIILYVSDQAISRDFYASVLKRNPILDVAGMTEFILTDEVKLGLMPESGIAKIITPTLPNPATGKGIPRCELYIYTETIEEDFKLAMKSGAVMISEIEDRTWGDRVGYLADRDGHIIALAKKIKN